MTRKLEIADWYEVQRVLKETYEIWSPGLSRERYREFVRMQMLHPWSRYNYTYLILRDKQNSKTPAASLKYYNLEFRSRGQHYKFAGFGAIYTRKDLRGEGYATDLIKQSLDRAYYEGCHGAILFSDIGVNYYARIGFFDLNNEKFILQLNDPHPDSVTHIPTEWTNHEYATASDTSTWSSCFLVEGKTVIRCRHLTTCPEQLEYVTRHYQRWLRKQPYGVERSYKYFHFKIMRENYLADHSSLAWPQLELLTVENRSSSGYAIIEYGGRVLRILELIGDEETRRLLWKGVIARARDLDAVRISGWESVLGDFRPGFSHAQLGTIDSSLLENCKSLMFADKTRGRTMILPLKDEIEDWLTLCPCPVLEMDHL
jgi:GNAT superfamily N-acetyltransferase